MRPGVRAAGSMGISGLLPFLSSIAEETRLSQFSGHTIGVDASCWLHRALSTCAIELAAGAKTDAHIRYCMELVRRLRADGVEPLLVFDGAAVAQKAATNEQRTNERKAARRTAASKRAAGALDEADALSRRSIGVTPAMVRRLIAALRGARVEFIVAPYEADAQLAHLARAGRVCAVLTEDSDLLAYGCPRTLFKWSARAGGSAELIALDDLASAECPKRGGHLFAGAWHREPEDWAGGLFLDMCVMAGCDYLPSLPSVGIRTAHALLREHRAVGPAVRARLAAAEADAYLGRFARVRDIFAHQLVWTGSEVAPLAPLPAGARLSALPHVGLVLSAELAWRVCVEASVDARTLEDVAPDEDDDEEEDGRAGGVRAESDARAIAQPPPPRGAAHAALQPPPARPQRDPFARPALPAARAPLALPPGLPRALPPALPPPPAADVPPAAAREPHVDDAGRASKYFASSAAHARAGADPAARGAGDGAASTPRTRAHARSPNGSGSARRTASAAVRTHRWEAGAARVGLPPESPPVLDRSVLSAIDRLCPLSSSPTAKKRARTAAAAPAGTQGKAATAARPAGSSSRARHLL